MFRSRNKDELSKLSKQQKESVKQYVKGTSTTEKAAVAALREVDWDLEKAMAKHRQSQQQQQQQHLHLSPFQHHHASAAASQRASADAQKQQLESFFNQYKDPDSDCILAEGISQLCEDLEVEPSDIVMLVLSWRLNAAAMCEFSREEFISGMQALRVDSAKKLQMQLPRLRAELEDERKFRQVYNYAFGWAKDKGQKWLALDMAVGMWQLLLGHTGWPLLDHWCTFVREKHNKSISKDTWTQLLDFTRIPVDALATYDDEGAWPCLVDDFVGYLQEQQVLPTKPAQE